MTIKSERRKRQRRANTADRRHDVFGDISQGITSSDIKTALCKKLGRIEVRVTAEEKQEIEALAARFSMTTSEYIRRLHGLVKDRLEG